MQDASVQAGCGSQYAAHGRNATPHNTSAELTLKRIEVLGCAI